MFCVSILSVELILIKKLAYWKMEILTNITYHKRAISTGGTIKSRRFFGRVFSSKSWEFTMGTIQERVLIKSGY